MGIPNSYLIPVRTATSINLKNPNIPAKVKVTNKSPYDAQYSGYGVTGADWIAAGTEYMLDGKVKSQGQLTLTLFNNANVTPEAPGSILVTTFDQNEQLPEGNWPVSIPFQTVSTSTVTTQAEQLINIGSSGGTTVIQVQPSDATGTNYTIVADNEGNFSVFTDDGTGVLTQALKIVAGASPDLQLGAINVITTHVRGKLSVIGTTVLDNGLITTDGLGGIIFPGKLGTVTSGDLLDAQTQPSVFIKAKSGGGFFFQSPNGTTVASIDSGGAMNPSNGVNYSIGRIKEVNSITGSGANGSISTGLGGTPSMISPDPSRVSGSTQTIGLTLAQTSTVTTGAGQAWGALCYR